MRVRDDGVVEADAGHVERRARIEQIGCTGRTSIAGWVNGAGWTARGSFRGRGCPITAIRRRLHGGVDTTVVGGRARGCPGGAAGGRT